VVVCDGFVGNVALKSAEGIAQLMGRFLTQEFKRNWITKSMAFVSLLVLNRFKKRLDPRRYNGASFLGLKGIVIKSHGGADSYSFFYAIRTAIEESKNNVLENIQKQLELEMPLGISSSENL
jgi:glycerol-3-phosphate acyltransferase PlsX